MNIKTFDFKAQQTEIEVKDLSFIKDLPNLLGKPHKVSFYQLVWVNDGVAKHRVDFQYIPVKKNEILVISPGQICEFDTSSIYTGKMILFTDSFFSVSELDTIFLYTSQIFSLVKQNSVIQICPTLMENLITLLEEEMKNTADRFQSGISQSILRIILFEAERKLNTIRTDNIPSVAREFFYAVEKSFKTNKKLEYYTDLLSIGEKTLSKEIKQLTGETPKMYIDRRVILEAKRLLSYSNLSVKEIGFSLGYDEPANFNNFFRKHVQQTPIQFRNESIK